MARDARRWRIVLWLGAIGALGAAAATLASWPRDEIPALDDAGGPPDAAIDARAAPAARAKGGKKPAARGGKTRVAGHAPHPPRHDKSPATPPSHAHERAPSGPSYESALGANDEEVTIGAKGSADLTDGQLAAPMSDGSFVAECGAPDSMAVTVKVAIRMGHAVGVSVETSPPSPHVAGCIDRHVRSLSWPASPKMDSLVTTY